jgi:hypothetical protein
MSQDSPPPYCLSRQHPELAARSPAPRGPIDSRRDLAASENTPFSQGLSDASDGQEAPAGKHL